MAAINKPSDINKIWADGGDKVSPSDVKIDLGWEVEVPPRQYFNWLDNKQDQFNAHVNQHGIPVWDAVTEYQAGKSYVQGSNGKIYLCLQTNTNQNPTTASAFWEPFIQHGTVVFSAAGVTNWTVPLAMQLGIIKPRVTLTAGGGGGSKVSGAIGNGGGGGGTAIKVVDLTGVTSVSITVGAGGPGAGGVAPSAGTAGGTTSFGAIFSATGGAGAGSTSAKVIGGSGVGGDINITGGSGAELQGNGDGGGSFWGPGGLGPASGSGQGSSGYGIGAGGAGSSGNQATGNGVTGVVIIEW